MISFAPVAVGSVHRVYFPAGTSLSPNIRSLDVVNCVAAFAPVRHTLFHGTTSLPKITRPRLYGRLYATSIFAVPTVDRTVSGGDICDITPRDASLAAQALAIASKSTLSARVLVVFTVVALEFRPRRCP